jgi:NhaP-type Na+/H+ or K+/H+ antiporter
VGEQELFTLAVAIAVVVIIGRVVASWLDVPDAVVLVVLGVLASLIPQIPNIELPPDLILLLFLPPLIYHAAFLSAPRETRENAVPITALGFGATTATILGVGWVTTLLLPHIGWPVAFAFAAAVAPITRTGKSVTRSAGPSRGAWTCRNRAHSPDGRPS